MEAFTRSAAKAVDRSDYIEDLLNGAVLYVGNPGSWKILQHGFYVTVMIPAARMILMKKICWIITGRNR
ncbi:MAG: hypothetical protein HFE76_16895 [Firmicutes bacterium]|nr:hypothetical protein [Bacillota bacterium]